MNVLLVDDEQLALQDLDYAVNLAIPNANRYCFNNANEALDFAYKNKLDIAFLDINMRIIDGITIAKKLKEKWPKINIIFCTGYDDYMKDAFHLHASGYLMKPITENAIKEEMKNLRYNSEEFKQLLIVDTNNFNIYDSNHVIIEFKRRLSKELFIILLKSKKSISINDLCAELWNDDDNLNNNKNYLMQLLTDIRHSFEDHDINGILSKDINGYYLNKTLIKKI